MLIPYSNHHPGNLDQTTAAKKPWLHAGIPEPISQKQVLEIGPAEVIYTTQERLDQKGLKMHGSITKCGNTKPQL